MWSYIAGGLKIKVKISFATKSSGLIIKGGLNIEGFKIEGLLYIHVRLRHLDFHASGSIVAKKNAGNFLSHGFLPTYR